MFSGINVLVELVKQYERSKQKGCYDYRKDKTV